MSALALWLFMSVGGCTGLYVLFSVVRQAVNVGLRRELPQFLHTSLAHREHITRIERSLEFIAGQPCERFIRSSVGCAEAWPRASELCSTCFAREAVRVDREANEAALVSAH